ncbi:sodium/proton antiporter, NhaA family [Azotobacter beijerinckii]|uniref:Na(+)/H(+) antiporter NhaA n=1 Tax=Azotobacter beijerinckii TaxID=170623 RepID=A0A1I4FP68_9GAMM|nr:Na+/H+ antiporter NhaA [Azotobacter beijerinckii]SFB53692.1 sodium/proton antiporter, NhaA family [Azotobacter beijerinckii]SFL19625.1 sodium/proton antiporter, NhaA family [Azotobacter beijerinckii]
MNQDPSRKALPSAQRLADKAFDALERFLHIEAVSGIVLLISAAIALIWANSPAAAGYEHLWHMPLSVGIGEHVVSRSLHFWINDALMTVFFLVVGMEIRREIHDGALASLKQAALPMAAALGGVAVPALLYLSVNGSEALRQGWAVPTATDIAFAVGVLALLGKSIPGSVRVFLLALAIIDDIVAVLIIALFFSGGLDPSGFPIAGVGIVLALGFQRIGIGSAWAYVLPGALLWFGLLQTGAHPTLAGVILGLMTPVFSSPSLARPVETATGAIQDFAERVRQGAEDTYQLMQPVKRLRHAQRELLPPVVRVQMALHPWVAYGVMPLFALANAGVGLDGVDLANGGSLTVMLGVSLALVVGKPLGVMLSSWTLVRLGWCRLPEGMSWSWMWLIGCLAGIGFTMSIFIATLAFDGEGLLSAAKLGVLLASGLAGAIGLVLGRILVVRARAASRR